MHLNLPNDQSTDPTRERMLVRGGIWQGDGPVPAELAAKGVRQSGPARMQVKLGGTNAEHGKRGAEATRRKRGKR